MKYVVARDIVIPAGTILHTGFSKVTFGGGHASAMIAHGKDTTSHWLIPKDEALELGVIELLLEEADEVSEYQL